MAFVLHLAEWVLDRPVRSVLDVGCGEGQWHAQLTRIRPGIRYDGVDPSAYAVTRFGARRNLQLGGICDLDALRLRDTYDLVICVGMLNYLSTRDLRHGMAQVARRTGGVAYLELFSRSDIIGGDTSWSTPKPASWYRRLIQSAGLMSIGMHGYVPSAHATRLAALERV